MKKSYQGEERRTNKLRVQVLGVLSSLIRGEIRLRPSRGETYARAFYNLVVEVTKDKGIPYVGVIRWLNAIGKDWGYRTGHLASVIFESRHPSEELHVFRDQRRQDWIDEILV